MTIWSWTEVLQVARDLHTAEKFAASEEARLRSTISRAYYAAYCTTRDFLVERGEISFVPREQSRLHTTMPETLKRSQDGRRQDVGRYLVQLRDARQDCDYEGTVDGLKDLARASLSRSQWVLEKVAKIRERS